MTRLRGAVIAFGVLLAAGCTAKPAQEAPAPQAVRVAAVREVSFASQLDLSGSVVASRQVVVGAVAAGRVTAVLVRAGDAVGAGQPVARIDDAAYRAAYAQAIGAAGAAGANVALARAQAEAARSRLQLAQTTALRMSALYAQGAIPRQQYDETQADLAASRAALLQANAAIAVARGSRGEASAAVAAAEVPLRDVVVRAPFDGVVLSRAVDPGAVVGAGSPVVTIQDDRNLELDVALPEEAAGSVRTGAPVPVRIDALGGRTFAARVHAVIPSQDAALRSVIVKLGLAPVPGLYTGMFARVRIAGPAHRAAAVPEEALVNRAGQEGVFAVEGSNVRFIPIQTGSTQGGWLEATDLPARVREVAVEGVGRLTDGAAVAIRR